MKKIAALFLTLLLILPSVITISDRASAQEIEDTTLWIANWENYIAEDEDGVPLWKKFEEKYNGKYKVEYVTMGTNEIMYNDLVINKKGDTYGYDLICPSDYMIQKMIKEDMLEKVDISKIPNYENYASPLFRDIFSQNGWDEYAVGYMWGTMGFFYNPETVNARDVNSWSLLWNIDYKGRTTLKDSIRDTYFLGLAYVFRDELSTLADSYESETLRYEIMQELYQAGSITAPELETALINYNAFLDTYSEELDSYLNNTDDETIRKVEQALKSASKNIYSFELEEGKSDIVTGKVDVNIAWSGDAVAFMYDAEDKTGLSLNYTVPREGSNIWFDGWVMPKGANKELAYLFLDFLSDPDIAIENMEYIGYTSAISGNDDNDSVFEWVQDTYAPADDAEITYDVDLSYFFGPGKVVTTDTLGRQFSAQYPDYNTIKRSVTMKNFDDETNAKISQMWERVRAKTLPVGVIIAIVAAVVVIAGAALTLILVKRSGGGPRKGKKNWTVVKKENAA